MEYMRDDVRRAMFANIGKAKPLSESDIKFLKESNGDNITFDYGTNPNSNINDVKVEFKKEVGHKENSPEINYHMGMNAYPIVGNNAKKLEDIWARDKEATKQWEKAKKEMEKSDFLWKQTLSDMEINNAEMERENHEFDKNTRKRILGNEG